ncbi:MAG TPA: hypothetical protein VL359_01820, partial [bacterium]|nr:hypothetical protein [bacterium]
MKPRDEQTPPQPREAASGFKRLLRALSWLLVLLAALGAGLGVLGYAHAWPTVAQAGVTLAVLYFILQVSYGSLRYPVIPALLLVAGSTIGALRGEALHWVAFAVLAAAALEVLV